MKKLAILTPGVLPVPAVSGGAVEQLVTYIIEGNETNHIYNIDLYTVNDPLLKNVSYKYTNLIKIDKKSKFTIPRFAFGLYNKIIRKVINSPHLDYMNLEFLKAFKNNYYDSVLVENNMELYSLLLTKRKKEKFYFHLHNDFDNGDVDKTIRNTKRIVKTADKIFVVSNFLKEKLNRLGAKQVKVAYNAVDENNLKDFSSKDILQEKNKFKISTKQYVFTYIGRLDKKKGIDKFLKAFKKLDSEYELNCKCLIVGGSWNNKSFQREINEIIASNKNIINIGYVPHDEIKKVFLISDCIVIPTQIEEAFGEVALEAMMMGKPIICSDSGALPEITSKKGRIVVKRTSDFEENLTQAMLKLVNNQRLSLCMGKSNLKESRKYPMTVCDYFQFFNSL